MLKVKFEKSEYVEYKLIHKYEIHWKEGGLWNKVAIYTYIYTYSYNINDIT